MGFDLLHYRVDSHVIRFTDKAILVEIDGEEKWLPMTKMNSICMESSGDLPIEVFIKLLKKKGVPKGRISSVEMDKWTNQYKIGLEEVV